MYGQASGYGYQQQPIYQTPPQYQAPQQQYKPIYQQPVYQPVYQQPEQAPTLKGRQVSNVDEAKAAQIDFDGSVFVFPDLSNKKIYTKQIQLDGSSAFNTYTMDDRAPQKAETEYVTKAEFDSTVAALKALLEGMKNERSVPTAQTDDAVAAF